MTSSQTFTVGLWTRGSLRPRHQGVLHGQDQLRRLRVQRRRRDVGRRVGVVGVGVGAPIAGAQLLDVRAGLFASRHHPDNRKTVTGSIPST